MHERAQYNKKNNGKKTFKKPNFGVTKAKSASIRFKTNKQQKQKTIKTPVMDNQRLVTTVSFAKDMILFVFFEFLTTIFNMRALTSVVALQHH